MPDISLEKSFPPPAEGTLLKVAGIRETFEFVKVGFNKNKTKFWWELLNQNTRQIKPVDPAEVSLKKRISPTKRARKTAPNEEVEKLNQKPGKRIEGGGILH